VIAPGLIVNAGMRATFARESTPYEIIHGGILVPREGHEDDIAGIAAFLLSDDGAYVTGQVITADGGEIGHYYRP